jgi:hypothetical protein
MVQMLSLVLASFNFGAGFLDGYRNFLPGGTPLTNKSDSIAIAPVFHVCSSLVHFR